MPAPPLALTDSQLTAVMQLARPLSPRQRSTFLEMLAVRLNGRRELGDGQVHRICAELLREHKLFDPPLESHPGSGRQPGRGKYE